MIWFLQSRTSILLSFFQSSYQKYQVDFTQMLTRVGWLDGWLLLLFSVYQALRAIVDSDPRCICKEIVKGFIKVYLFRSKRS
jgi:hypothetical protein